MRVPFVGLFSLLCLPSLLANSHSTGGDELDATARAFDGVYAECLLKLSYTCLQKKTILFLYKLDKMKEIPIVPDAVAFRKNENAADRYHRKPEWTNRTDRAYLKGVVDDLVDKFFRNHFLRIKMPGMAEDATAALDIQFGDETSGRKKESSSKKGMKKMMMMAAMMMCSKLSAMVPLMLGLAGLKALKAIIFSVISLTLTKMMMMHSMKGKLGSIVSAVQKTAALHGWDRSGQADDLQAIPYEAHPIYAISY